MAGNKSRVVSHNVYFKSHFLSTWLINQFLGSVTDDALAPMLSVVVFGFSGIRKKPYPACKGHYACWPMAHPSYRSTIPSRPRAWALWQQTTPGAQGAPQAQPRLPPGNPHDIALTHPWVSSRLRTCAGTLWVLLPPLRSILQAVLAEVGHDAAALLPPLFIARFFRLDPPVN